MYVYGSSYYNTVYVRHCTLQLNSCNDYNNCTNISSDGGANPVKLAMKQLCSKIIFDFRKCIETEQFMIIHTISSFLSPVLGDGKLDFP